MVKDYHRELTVRYNPHWTESLPGEQPDPDFRWMVCQRIYEMEEVGDGAKVFHVRPRWFTVLGIGPTCKPDRRIIENLESNRLENFTSMPQEFRDRSVQEREDFADYMYEWARGPGYYLWKRDYGSYRFPTVDFSSPEDRHKAMQDKLGRELI
jgi:hypothetical protein